ncbi:hypothetical protein V8E52_001872 [Russula decolorans]
MAAQKGGSGVAPLLAWCPNVFPTPRIHPSQNAATVATIEDRKEAHRFQIPNNHNVIPLNSTVSSANSAASSSLSPSSPSFIRLIGSSCPYEMSSDMTFASFVPTAAFTMSTLMTASASVLTTPKPTVRASGSTTRCGASTPPARRLLPVQHDLTTPRARARAARLRANEAAERREDLAALVTTPAQWALLRRSFAGVKTEFADLDGMSWHVLMPLTVSAPAVAGPRPGRRPPLRGSTSVSSPALVLDDRTVRPTFKRKQRPSVSVPGWGQRVTSQRRAPMT